MPYGPQPDGISAAGTLELLARSEIIASGRLFDDAAESSRIETGAEQSLEGPEMDDAATAAANARVVIMNPPFSNRSKVGEKFDSDDQRALRQRMDALEQLLVNSEPSLDGVLDKNSVQPMFETLAGYCLAKNDTGVIVMIAPTIIATATSAEAMRPWMSERFHVHTVLTNFATRDGNLSQNTEINESIFVFRRCDGPHPPTRVIALDRFPAGEHDIETLHSYLRSIGTGTLPDGWGEVSFWPAERIAAGDWTAAVWRSPDLASAAVEFADSDDLAALQRERETSRPPDTADAQRPIPQSEEHGQRGPVKVHTTLQQLYADYRKVGSQRKAKN